MKKIAIIKNDIDLVRIIPAHFRFEKGKFGLKISFLRRKFKTRYWQLGDKLSIDSETCEEMTYHSSSENYKTACVLIKENGIHRNIFSKMSDIKFNIKSPVPLPICKVNFTNIVGKTIKKKDKYHLIELKDIQNVKPNTVEIYLAHKDFDMNKIMYQWRCLNLIFIIASIDVIVKGTSHSLGQFLDILRNGNYPYINMIECENYNLIYKIYFEENINCNQISFYENSDYLAVLSSTPVSIKHNDKCSSVEPAYHYDLLDLERNNDSSADIWRDYFKSITKKVIASKIHKGGIIIPRD
jgi:hypothetical protein